MAKVGIALYLIRGLESELPVEADGVNRRERQEVVLDSVNFFTRAWTVFDRAAKLSGGVDGSVFYDFKPPQRSGRRIWGCVDMGDSGRIIPVRNTRTGAMRTTIIREEAPTAPRRFYMEFPTGAEYAVLAVERVDNRTCLAPVFALLQSIEEIEPSIRVSREEAMPSELMQRLLEPETIKRIRVTRYSLPPDIADQVELGPKTDAGHVEYSVVADRGIRMGLRDRIKQFRSGKINAGQVISLPPNFGDPDDISVVVDMGGGEKTYSLTSGTYRSVVDVTKRVGFDENGDPHEDLLQIEAWEAIRGYLVSLGDARPERRVKKRPESVT